VHNLNKKVDEESTSSEPYGFSGYDFYTNGEGF
jgi:hypothetical protein